jgi:hypothetical protein
LKFRHQWETKSGAVTEPLPEHTRIIQSKGKSWWGTGNSSVSQERAEAIRMQIESGVPTYAFLYAMWVPKSVHPDTNMWFKARVHAISVGVPPDVSLIPEYYRADPCASYFLLSDIQPISYEPGTTPKVPGQASIRHVSLNGTLRPENLYFKDDPTRKVCVSRSESARVVTKEAETAASDYEARPNSSPDLAMRVIDLQDEIIHLKDEVKNLQSYKDFYNKILTADYLFSSEKFFESWIQDNFHKILPDCEVLERQPIASWPDGKFGRFDLLAMNKESKDLVIVEVKTRKRSKSSGYDQFVRYVSWAKRNREMLGKKYSSQGLVPSDDPQFVIITDYADDEMKAICRDHGIQLHIVIGGLSFERAA